jgi:hypothetical protein
MNYDEQAYLQFIDGQNDALALASPQEPNNPYYMMGWHDAKRRLARGKLCREFEQIQAEIEYQKNWTYAEQWEEF